MPGGAHENMRGWSPEEDELLLQLIESSGKRWKLIAEALGNANPRTPAMVRNRYLRIERGRWLTERGMSKNRCGQCGELKRGHVCRVPRALVNTDLSAQGEHHHQVRQALGGVPGEDNVPTTPSDGGATVNTLALGAPPLTMPFASDGDSIGGPLSALASPGPLSCGLSLGLSPGISPLPSIGAGAPSLSMGTGPPALRVQNSMEILLQASDLHRVRAAGDTPASSVGGDVDNPFRPGAELPPELCSEVANGPPSFAAKAEGVAVHA